MSSNLEKVVRPFSLPIGQGARTLVDSPAPEGQNTEIVEAEWGGEIDNHYTPLSDTLMEFGVVSRWQEASRTTRTVRVSNPDDASQFVDVERIERLTMRNLKSRKEQEWILNN